MGFFNWRQWLKRKTQPFQRSAPRRFPSRRLELETLEERLTPTTDTWTGLGANTNWKTALNWSNGVPVNGADLVFPGGVPNASLTSNNNIVGASFNSITISGSSYNLGGNPITLGNASGGTTLFLNGGASGIIISLNVQMGGGAGFRQFFTESSGADLTLSGQLLGTTGVELTKDGVGTLILANDNSGFTGPITVQQGILEITTAKALGDTSQGTTVDQNAQLLVLTPSATTFSENLILNGPGPVNDGALLDASGPGILNIWTGTVTMDSDTTIGASAGSSLTFAGKVGDLGAGHNLTKEGAGDIFFNAANTYRGTTTVNNGTLHVGNAMGLGFADGSAQTGTTVNRSNTKVGTLALDDPLGVGFTVQNELLTLNGTGVGAIGALDNVSGDNTWTGNVILGSPAPNGSNVSIGAEAPDGPTTMTISGIVMDPNGVRTLTKVGLGTVVLTRANTYRGTTTVAGGILDIRDSNGLGAIGAGTTVNDGATLQLDVDGAPDSVTGTTFTLNVSEPLSITGTGVNGQGALRSGSGINVYSGTISITGAEGAIGVDPDPNASNSNAYFPTYNSGGVPIAGDYSLTVAAGGHIVSGVANQLDKVGLGQLILPTANNQLAGPTDIQEGWVTVQDNNSLGPPLPLSSQANQVTITVDDGAALHLKPLLPGGSLSLTHNFHLVGVGIVHPFSQLSQEGAVLNLDGVNTISGNIQLGGNVGIGSNLLDPGNFPASQLFLTGSVAETKPVFNLNNNFNGNGKENDKFLPAKPPFPPNGGTLTVTYAFHPHADRMTIYYGAKGTPGSTQLLDTGYQPFGGQIIVDYTATTATVTYSIYSQDNTSGTLLSTTITTVNYGPLGPNQIEIIVNEGGNAIFPNATVWTYKATLVPGVVAGSITKLGSQLVVIQGDGNYSGPVDIKEGVLLNQSHTGLGGGTNTTTVEAGAALALANATPYDNGGLRAGIQVFGESLVLNGSGNTTLVVPGNPNPVSLAPLTILSNSALLTGTPVQPNTTPPSPADNLIAPSDIMWRGPVSLNNSAAIDVQTGSRLNILGAIDDAAQTLTLPSGTGTFTLTFKGAKTGLLSLSSTTLATDISVALNALSTIGGLLPVPGLVTVVQSPVNPLVFHLTFAGSLSAIQPLVIGTGIAPAADPVVTGTGSDLIKVGAGELILAGSNSYRGITYVGSQTDPDAVNEFFSPSSPQPLAGGTLTVANSQALGGTTGGTVVDNGSSLQLEGNISIAGESLTIQGSGVASVPTPLPQGWFEVGPAAITGGQTLGTLTAPLAGRVTGVAVDPTDSGGNTIYISTADGGAWKTNNGGKTWLPLFDSQSDSTTFGGAIAVAPSNANIVYFGTGEADNSTDSFAGTGVYKSTDGGHTWDLLVSSSGIPNPLNGKAVSRIVVDPGNANRIYASTSDRATNASAGGAGVWRFDATSGGWFCLTTVVSTVRKSPPASGGFPAAVNTPGPDDNFGLSFPNSGVYSDLAITQAGVLYMALGIPGGNANNAVYRSQNPTSNNPVWFVGDGNPSATYTAGGSGAFPVGVGAGNIKIGAIGANLSGTTVYASIAAAATGGLVEVAVSADGGQTWKAVATAPTNYLGTQGNYDSTLVAVTASKVYIGGQNDIQFTIDGGTTWTPIPADAAGNGPHANFHASASDALGRVVVGTDGGVWRTDPANTNNWTDLNANLAISELNGVGIAPSNPGLIFGGSQSNGSATFAGTQAWASTGAGDGGLVRVDPTNTNFVYEVVSGTLFRSTTGGGAGSFSALPLSNFGVNFPFLLDAVSSSRLLAGIGAFVEESINQGTSWSFLGVPGGGSVTALAAAAYQGTFATDNSFSQVTDQGANTYDPNTIYAVTANNRVNVTKNHGTTWVNRTSNLPAGLTIQDILVDPTNRDTAYIVGNTAAHQGDVFRTTDAGKTWTEMAINPLLVPAYKLVLDSRNGGLYLGADNGVYLFDPPTQSWGPFGAGLPNVQVRDMVLDQTLNTLTIGTYGRSVYQIFLNQAQPNAGALVTVAGSSVWTGPVFLAGDTVVAAEGTQALHNGIAAAQLNIVGPIADLTGTTNNKLTKIGGGNVILSGANSYTGITEVQQGDLIVHNPQALGSSTNGTIVDPGTALQLQSSVIGEPLTLFGDGPVSGFNGHNTGALENATSNNTYSGTITLATNATIGVDSGSTLAITGPIADNNGGFSLTKELTGTLVLNAANTYGGVTNVNQGILQVQNAQALGTTTAGTVVLDGAQLLLQSAQAQKITVAGTTGTFTLKFNGQPTVPLAFNVPASGGSLPAESMQNALQALSSISGAGLGGSVSVTKAANVYTVIFQGGLAGFDQPLMTATGTGGASAVVSAGNGQPVVVAGESLSLAGTGIVGTGALLDGRGSDTWTGPISLDSNPGFSPATAPPGVVAIGVTNAGDKLSVTGSIGDSLPTGLSKVGAGGLLLTQANNYRGTTYITGGVLTIQDAQSLGAANSQEVQRVTVGGSTGSFTLTFNGQPTAALNFNAPATGLGSVQSALGGLAAVGGNANVDVVKTSITSATPSGNQPFNIYTVTFQGALAGQNLPLMTAAGNNGELAVASQVADGGIGALVNAGTALVLDLDPTNTGTPKTVTGEPLQLNGSGVSGAGAVDNISGVNTWAAAINLNTSSAIGVDGGTLTATGDVSGAAAATLSKVGVGTLLFPNANDYQGTTQVQKGILSIGANTSLGATASNEMQTVSLAGPASGSFTLTFKGQTTTMPLSITSTNTQVANALNALLTIGPGGSVNVTKAGNVFTVTFLGNLAGIDQPLMTANGAGGVSALVALVTDGGIGGTVVSSGATLQVQNNITVTGELLTLSGAGFNGIGALDSSAGANTWDSPIILAANTSIGADTDQVLGQSTLTVDVTIAETGSGKSLTKVGTGILALTGNTSNTYTGPTLVNDGVLQLDKLGGATAIPAALTVGDGSGNPLSAVVQMIASNQFTSSNPAIVVNSDGSFDLNGQSQAIGTLAMTGGTVKLTGGGSLLTLGGDVTAVSDGAGLAAIVTGPGTLALGATTRKFTVTHPIGGAALVDMTISSVIAGPSGVGINKLGNGTLQLTNTETYPGTTTVTTGALDVDGALGKIGNVSLAGGTLAGNLGSVAQVTAVAAGGTVHPGDGTAAGILTASGNVVLNGNSTFNASLGGPNPGADYSQLFVNGIATLGNAKLAGQITGAFLPTVGETFDIIRSPNQIAGQFTQGATVFLSGEKFTVNYNVFDAGTNTFNVRLTRVPVTTTTAVTVVPASGVPNTIYNITATITPEVGTTLVTPGSVKFTVTGPNAFNLVSTITVAGNTATLQLEGLAIGTYTVASAQYTSTDAGYLNSAATTTPTFTVSKDNTTTSVPTANPLAPLTYGQQVTFTTTISPNTQGGGIGNLLPGGTATFKDGTTAFVGGTVGVTANGTVDTASFTATLLSAGTHHINASYNGDANYNASSGGSLTYLVNKAGSTILVASTNSAAVYGEATITAKVTPQFAGTPTGTVTFSIFNGVSTIAETDPIQTVGGNQVATLQQALVPGAFTITATYNGDANFVVNAVSNTLNQNVDPATTTTTVASSSTSNTSVFGEAVTFSATINAVSPGGTAAGSLLPGGTADLVVGGDTLQAGAAVSAGHVTFTAITSMAVGNNTVQVVYNGDNNYVGSDNTLAGGQTVNAAATTVGVTSSDNPSVVGELVTFIATVAAKAPGSGTPTGTVQFYSDASPIGGVQALQAVAGHQQASVAIAFASPTAAGTPHVITATYSSDTANFLGQTATLTNGQTVNKAGTTTTASASPNPANYGQPVSFTATVAVSAPGAGIATGNVIFYDGFPDNAHLLGQGALNQNALSNQAGYTTTALQLTGGTHTIIAVYQGNTNFITSQGNTPLQTVSRVATSTTAATTSNAGAFYGQPITFSATVSAGPGLGIPTGTINFYDGPVNANDLLGAGSVNTGTGQATLTLPSASPVLPALGFGNHTITAVYQGDTNFLTSTSPNPQLVQTVSKATTSTTLGTDTPNAVYGQETVTATVADTSPGSTGTPSGNVIFTIGNGSSTVNVTVALSNGVATLTSPTAVQTALTAGGQNPSAYTISAAYQGDGSFGISNTGAGGSLAQNVSQAASSTAVTATPVNNQSVAGQQVTFTAVVAAGAPGAGLPSGTVNFYNGTAIPANLIGFNTLSLVSGQETTSIQVTGLAVGSSAQPITAVYLGDNNFLTGTSNTVNFTVNQAATTTAVSSSSPTSTFGSPVGLTATVAVTTPGAGTATGNVNFYDGLIDNGHLLGVGALNQNGVSDQAVITTTALQLTGGNHTIIAVYQGDGSFSTSQGSTPQTVLKAVTTTTLVAPTATPVIGHAYTFTATVASAQAGLGTPGGTVTFTVDSGAPLQVGLNPAGQAFRTISFSTPGAHNINASYDGDPSFAASNATTLVETALTQVGGFVAQVYLDLLHRPVDPNGLASWTNALNLGTLSRTGFVAALESSLEYRSDAIDAIYVHYLHRHVDPNGLSTFQTAMAAGLTDEGVAAILVGSPEYFTTRGGNTVDGFLTALYGDALNRLVDADGRKSFTQALSFHVSRQQVAAIILGSFEYKSDLASGYYTSFLHRPADPVGLSNFANIMTRGFPDELVIATLIGSDEYFNNI